MSLVTLYSGGREVSGEASVARTWRLPSAGEAGQATFTLPYTSPLVDLIDLDAGVLALIHDADGCGAWWGVVVDADWSDAGLTVTAYQPWMMLGRRYVRLSGVRRAVQPGMVVTEALKDGGQVLGLMMPGAPFDGDSPLIDLWEWSDRDVWSVITEQMGRGFNELWVDPETREMAWIGPLAEADAYAPLLIAGQSLRNWRVSETNADRVTEVFGLYNSLTQTTTYGSFTPSGQARYTAYHGETAVANWPAQAAVNAESPSTVRDAAHAELGQRSAPAITISGALARDHIAIRERNYVDIFVPRKGLTYTCRVMARTVDDTAEDIGVELLVMPGNGLATTLKAPGFVSRDIGRGTGSIGQRVLHGARWQGRRV